VHGARGRRLSAPEFYTPEGLAGGAKLLWPARFRAFGIALAVGVVAFFFLPASFAGSVRIVSVFDCTAATLLAMIWFTTISDDAAQTARRAALEDPGRNAVSTIILLSSLIGVTSAIGILGHPQKFEHPGESTFVLALGLAGVALSWIMIQTMMTLRYAHLYYYDDNDDGKPGGLQFPGDDAPSDYDFAYFSFVIGMTFQVSDVQITSRRIRRTVLGHGIVSFLFSTTIVALGVNILSGLIGH
jgi:uncharacterized membrane protein